MAEDAQELAAALNHSSLNTASALDPWLAGLAIAGGYGSTATCRVRCGLALGGLAICAAAKVVGRFGTTRAENDPLPEEGRSSIGA